MALVMPFMAVGPLSRWREDTTRRWLHELLVPGLGVLVVAIVLAFLGSDDFNLWLAFAVLLAGCCLGLFDRYRLTSRLPPNFTPSCASPSENQLLGHHSW